MSRLEEVKEVIVPKFYADAMYEHLQNFGQDGFEGVALWVGVQKKNQFEVRATFIPEQKSFSHDTGLMYSVDEAQLHRLNIWLYENKMALIAQIHSHPAEAYHSHVDDAYPIITEIGGLSIVVPNFAAAPMNIAEWAIYRLEPKKGWVELKKQEIASTIKII